MTSPENRPTLVVNGAPAPLPSPKPTIAALLQAMGLDARVPGTAVARNGEVVPRRLWAEVTLEPRDEIEVVTAAQGG